MKRTTTLSWILIGLTLCLLATPFSAKANSTIAHDGFGAVLDRRGTVWAFRADVLNRPTAYVRISRIADVAHVFEAYGELFALTRSGDLYAFDGSRRRYYINKTKAMLKFSILVPTAAVAIWYNWETGFGAEPLPPALQNRMGEILTDRIIDGLVLLTPLQSLFSYARIARFTRYATFGLLNRENFFTRPVASGISRMHWQAERGEWLIIPKDRDAETVSLHSLLAPTEEQLGAHCGRLLQSLY